MKALELRAHFKLTSGSLMMHTNIKFYLMGQLFLGACGLTDVLRMDVLR